MVILGTKGLGGELSHECRKVGFLEVLSEIRKYRDMSYFVSQRAALDATRVFDCIVLAGEARYASELKDGRFFSRRQKNISKVCHPSV